MKSSKESAAPDTAVLHHKGRPMTILYGSDTGTCEALANHLKVEASARGFSPSVSTMNMAVNKLPHGRKLDPFTATSHFFLPQVPVKGLWSIFGQITDMH